MSEAKKLTIAQKEKLSQIGQKHKLDLMVLYGSMAKRKTHKNSDADIAIYKNGGISSDKYFEIYGEIISALGGFEVDVKTLHRANPLFRFFVTNDGLLLYGDPLLFTEMKASAYRAYQDSRDLFVLEHKLNEKGINQLLNRYA